MCLSKYIKQLIAVLGEIMRFGIMVDSGSKTQLENDLPCSGVLSGEVS